MGSLFKRTGDWINRSPFIVPVFFVFVAMLVTAIALFYEDYSTSYLGYIEIPTRKANTWIYPFVALTPQLINMAMAYMFLRDTKNNRWAMFIGLFATAVDIGTDVYYKINVATWTMNGQGIFVLLSALTESFILYTVGSEWMLVLSFGTLMEITPHAVEQIGKVISKMLGDGDGHDGGGGNFTNPPPRGNPPATIIHNPPPAAIVQQAQAQVVQQGVQQAQAQVQGQRLARGRIAERIPVGIIKGCTPEQLAQLGWAVAETGGGTYMLEMPREGWTAEAKNKSETMLYRKPDENTPIGRLFADDAKQVVGIQMFRNAFATK